MSMRPTTAGWYHSITAAVRTRRRCRAACRHGHAVIDEVGYDLVDMPGIALADTVFESLDHEA